MRTDADTTIDPAPPEQVVSVAAVLHTVVDEPSHDHVLA